MKAEIEKASSFAYRVLASRPRTRLELELCLEKKGFSAEASRQVLEQMAHYGYIDDGAFARLWVEQRKAKRGLGGLERELLAKGVSRTVIREVLAEMDPEEEYRAARDLIAKKVRKSASTLSRVAGLLERRGFSYEVIGRICRAVCLSDGVKP